MKPPRKPLSKRLGSALVMTLVIIVLITVVTVGYLASVMLETKTAGSSLDQERAYGIAVVGAHEAMARIREALGPWDDPYKNFATNPAELLLVAVARAHHALVVLSIAPRSPTLGSSRNRPVRLRTSSTSTANCADGSYPIIGGADPPEVSVKWANLLRDPSQPASASNADRRPVRLLGR